MALKRIQKEELHNAYTEREHELDRAQRGQDETEERNQGEESVQAEGPGEVRAEQGEKRVVQYFKWNCQTCRETLLHSVPLDQLGRIYFIGRQQSWVQVTVHIRVECFSSPFTSQQIIHSNHQKLHSQQKFITLISTAMEVFVWTF
ncbi:ubiquitin-conjugating enzyme E2 D4 isoform 4-T4 [Pholidichthys leucotaenia]